MNLVEAESTGPIKDADEPVVTPPRAPHRRVSVSLVFTLTVLTGTVIAIYLTFPTRNTVLMAEALERHRADEPGWDLINPSAAELRAWAIGVVGRDPPLPHQTVMGARDVEVLGHRAAMIRLDIDGDTLTYLVQYTRVIAPEESDRTDGDLHAIAFRRGLFTIAAVGPKASASSWVQRLYGSIR